jgi:hypothetical protein
VRGGTRRGEREGERKAGGTNTSGSAHGVGHLLITAQRLDAQTDRLQLRAHLVELLDVSPRADEVLCHDLACVLRANGTRVCICVRGRWKEERR